jgi:16S rRNA (guanine527-N7)-methyltransferase
MKGKQLIASHFPDLTDHQLDQLENYVALLLETNQRVNLISRKNEARVWEEHILHSLSIAKVVQFESGTRVLDFGTGGGLPGIPLAIVFPEANFTLIDSIGKKTNAVEEMRKALHLDHVTVKHGRVETLNQRFDFAVSRAVTALPTIAQWLRGKLTKGDSHGFSNGLIYIKGGDFGDELTEIGRPSKIWNMQDWFEDPFFETKKVVWIDLAS